LLIQEKVLLKYLIHKAKKKKWFKSLIMENHEENNTKVKLIVKKVWHILGKLNYRMLCYKG